MRTRRCSFPPTSHLPRSRAAARQRQCVAYPKVKVNPAFLGAAHAQDHPGANRQLGRGQPRSGQKRPTRLCPVRPGGYRSSSVPESCHRRPAGRGGAVRRPSGRARPTCRRERRRRSGRMPRLRRERRARRRSAGRRRAANRRRLPTRRSRILLDRGHRDIRPRHQARHDPGGAHARPGAELKHPRAVGQVGGQHREQSSHRRDRRTSGRPAWRARAVAAATSGGMGASADMAMLPPAEDGHPMVEPMTHGRKEQADGGSAPSCQAVLARAAATISRIASATRPVPGRCYGRFRRRRHGVPAGLPRRALPAGASSSRGTGGGIRGRRSRRRRARRGRISRRRAVPAGGEGHGGILRSSSGKKARVVRHPHRTSGGNALSISSCPGSTRTRPAASPVTGRPAAGPGARPSCARPARKVLPRAR